MNTKIRLIAVSIALLAVAVWATDHCISPPTTTDFPFEYVHDTNLPRVIGTTGIGTHYMSGSEVRGCQNQGYPYVIEPVQVPDGVVWDANIDTWYWLPDVNDVGPHPFVFGITSTAPDGEVQTTIETYVVNVILKFDPPVLEPPTVPFVVVSE